MRDAAHTSSRLPRALAVLAAGCAVAAARPARADGEPVRDDIVDLRHGRHPDRRQFLGWTQDGRAVVHAVTCSRAPNDDEGRCRAVLWVAAEPEREAPEAAVTTLFALEDDRVDTATASRAIRAERAALEALGPLTPAGAPPTAAVTARRVPTGVVIQVDGRTVAHPVRTPSCEAGVCDHLTDGASDVRLRAVHASPDGIRAAVVFDYVHHRGDSWSRLAVVVEIVALLPP